MKLTTQSDQYAELCGYSPKYAYDFEEPPLDLDAAYLCTTCGGTGIVADRPVDSFGMQGGVECPVCEGTGDVRGMTPLVSQDLGNDADDTEGECDNCHRTKQLYHKTVPPAYGGYDRWLCEECWDQLDKNAKNAKTVRKTATHPDIGAEWRDSTGRVVIKGTERSKSQPSSTSPDVAYSLSVDGTSYGYGYSSVDSAANFAVVPAGSGVEISSDGGLYGYQKVVVQKVATQ